MTTTGRLRRALAAAVVALAATIGVVAGGLAVTAGPAHATALPGELLNLGSSSCLAGDGDPGFQPNRQDPIQEEIYPCDRSAGQQWTPRPLSRRNAVAASAYELVDGNNNCLGVPGASQADGAPVEWQPCGQSGAAQQWTPYLPTPANQYHSFELVNLQTSQCLGIFRAATAPGSLAVQWPCDYSANQLWNGAWFFGSLTNSASGECMGVQNAPQAGEGSAIVLASCQNTTDQAWQFDSTDSSVRNGFLALCLDVAGGSTAAGAQIVQELCNGSPDQQWTYTSSGWLENPNTGMCVTASLYHGRPATPYLHQLPCNGLPMGDVQWAFSPSSRGM
jgi:hypothetical protein